MDLPTLMDTATAYWRSATLQAALEIGVFGPLAREAQTAEALAGALATSPAHTEALLDALAGMGILTKRDGQYEIVKNLQPFLSPGSPVSLLDALRYNHDLYPLWGRLAEGVTTGKPVTPPGAHLGEDAARTERFVKGMYSRGRVLAPVMAEALDLGDAKTLLDVASGPGVFSAALARRYPGLQVTLFDLPAVLAVAEELLSDQPEATRIQYVPGDYHRDALPSGFDAALYCGALHQEREEDARTLFAQIAGVLEPGGILYVVDLMVDEDGTTPVFSALFSLNMMLTRPHGHVYTRTRTMELLKQAGFDVEQSGTVPRTPYACLKTRLRPAG